MSWIKLVPENNLNSILVGKQFMVELKKEKYGMFPSLSLAFCIASLKLLNRYVLN